MEEQIVDLSPEDKQDQEVEEMQDDDPREDEALGADACE